MTSLGFNAPADRLQLNENTTAGILAVSVAACTLSFADALQTVGRRGRYLQEAVPRLQL